jgi:U4/U6 small nuclear ribonucleoprotein PRP4
VSTDLRFFVVVILKIYVLLITMLQKLTRFLTLSASISSLSGAAKLWSMPQVTKVCTLKGHTERATDVAFSPFKHDHLATASADRTARLWNTEGSLLRTFEGHLDRLARISFHPSGKYLGTTSFDNTWRLWDVETGEELLLQEGHSRSVYGIAFHHDGSLAASCGLDALARVWDLRTGKSILALEGHVKPVSSKFHLLFFFFWWPLQGVGIPI